MDWETNVSTVSRRRRELAMRLPAMVAACLLFGAAAALAQAQSASKVEVWSKASTARQFAGMVGTAKAKGIAIAQLGTYDGYGVELTSRAANGQVEVHDQFVDIFFVIKGQATLLTGGTVVGGKSQGNGEVRGTSMRGGERHAISAGDTIRIPAGVPHQLLLQPGTIFEAEIVKVKIAK